MQKTKEINLCGVWTSAWEMEPGEFVVTIPKSGCVEDHWVETICFTEQQEKAVLTVVLDGGMINHVVDALFGAIVVFCVEELP